MASDTFVDLNLKPMTYSGLFLEGLEELDELKRRKVERDERIQERIKSWEKQHVGKGWFAA